ncbi:hypothetical protein [Bifidobacterium ruminantium]|uniref:hypothetical protein n=1 Tax=Bifidobacterium ruminantium TaxID=78346 RepID=UPI0024934267|nr:hypothetical protein [Bifidobacterium ruminantium]
MIHDNGNVHDGVGPDWNPFARDDGDNEDDIGWDDGSGDHAGRMPLSRKGVVILAVCTLVVAVVSIGLVITESNMSVHRHQLASACENAVMEMGQARERLNEHVDARLKSIDTRSLTARQKREYESLRQVDKTVSIDCDAGQRNSRLEENARKAEQEARGYAKQSKRVDRFARAYDRRAAKQAARENKDRLGKDIDEARSLLERIDGMDLTVPYLRTRLMDTLSQAEQAVNDTDDSESVTATLEDLMGQVRESAGL